jgi:hypothetical protein
LAGRAPVVDHPGVSATETTLRRQFDLAWSLLDLHLRALTDDDHLWEPAPSC